MKTCLPYLGDVFLFQAVDNLSLQLCFTMLGMVLDNVCTELGDVESTGLCQCWVDSIICKVQDTDSSLHWLDFE